MSDNARIFFSLHAAAQPLVLPNAWDAASAALFQDTGATAIATSSASLAWALGYKDGGGLPRQELMGAVERILRVIGIPLTVDMEDGYSDDPAEVAALAAQLAQAGAVGINLEDGSKPPAVLAAKIAAIRGKLDAGSFFINARTDVYLRSLAPAGAQVPMAVERAQQYRAAGADGIFVPGVVDEETIRELVAAIPAPLNILVGPGAPSVPRLGGLGVRRASLGSSVAAAAYAVAEQSARELADHGTYDSVRGQLDYGRLNGLVG